MGALALLVAVVAVIVLLRAFLIVPPNQAFVVEKLGRANRVLSPGLHILTPFLDRVSARVPTGSQTVETFTGPTPLASGAEASASGTVEFRVADVMLAVSSVADYRDALDRLTANAWRQAIAASDHLSVIDRVRGAEASIRAAAEQWGLAVVSSQPAVELGPEAMQALEAAVERERDARVAEWVTSRRQRLGPDGRPTKEQHAAFREWLDHETKVHADEIERARRAAGDD